MDTLISFFSKTHIPIQSYSVTERDEFAPVETLGNVAIVFLAMLVCALADEKYTTKYDNIDLDSILNSDRLLNNYVNCLLDVGSCTPDGKELKKTLPDALESDCAKCSEKQKTGSEKVIRFLINKSHPCLLAACSNTKKGGEDSLVRFKVMFPTSPQVLPRTAFGEHSGIANNIYTFKRTFTTEHNELSSESNNDNDSDALRTIQTKECQNNKKRRTEVPLIEYSSGSHPQTFGNLKSRAFSVFWEGQQTDSTTTLVKTNTKIKTDTVKRSRNVFTIFQAYGFLEKFYLSDVEWSTTQKEKGNFNLEIQDQDQFYDSSTSQEVNHLHSESSAQFLISIRLQFSSRRVGVIMMYLVLYDAVGSYNDDVKKKKRTERRIDIRCSESLKGETVMEIFLTLSKIAIRTYLSVKRTISSRRVLSKFSEICEEFIGKLEILRNLEILGKPEVLGEPKILKGSEILGEPGILENLEIWEILEI
ncbi:Ejaculatory bulb-specific protein 3 [Melipona quadrifasciata]|uniref:Ejaculatory bulb-specific protein 3 n=2 Tax=Melipona TaxID=28651 RepID=A0A0N0BIX2_9HYME|nr:Ejaculatory bulb-specific protein 3 [Melipona quadrifasciata]